MKKQNNFGKSINSYPFSNEATANPLRSTYKEQQRATLNGNRNSFILQDQGMVTRIIKTIGGRRMNLINPKQNKTKRRTIQKLVLLFENRKTSV